MWKSTTRLNAAAGECGGELMALMARGCARSPCLVLSASAFLFAKLDVLMPRVAGSTSSAFCHPLFMQSRCALFGSLPALFCLCSSVLLILFTVVAHGSAVAARRRSDR